MSQKCEQTPQDGREHIYTFLINGVDPFYFGNLNGLSGRLCEMGFPQTNVGQFWQYRTMASQIRGVRKTDPEAKVVLVGFSLGAIVARKMAKDLEAEGVRLDALVYLGGDLIRNEPSSWPANVSTVVNIQGHGYWLLGYDLFVNGQDIDKAQNLRLPVRHMLLPSRSETVATLATQMSALANDVHVILAARKSKQPTPAAVDTKADEPVSVPSPQQPALKISTNVRELPTPACPVKPSDAERTEYSLTSYYFAGPAESSSKGSSWRQQPFSPQHIPGFPIR